MLRAGGNRRRVAAFKVIGKAVGKKDRQHYIPQFLLRRFASRVDAKSGATFVFQTRKESAPKEVSVRDAAVASQFYGNSANGVEDALGKAEDQFGTVLRQLDAGASVDNYVEAIGNFIWLHTVRTRALRESMATAFKLLFDRIAQEFTSERAQNEFQRFFEDEIEVIADTAFEQKHPNLPSQERSAMVTALLAGGNRQAIVDIFKQSGVVTWGLTMFGQLLQAPQLRKQLDTKLKDAHSRSVARLINERIVPAALQGCHFQIIASGSDHFILGDCCAFVVGKDAAIEPVNRNLSEMRELYLPISSTQALAALRGIDQPTLTTPEINLGSVICSRDALFSRDQSGAANLAHRIGENAHMVTPRYVDEIAQGFDWRESIRRSLSSRN